MSPGLREGEGGRGEREGERRKERGEREGGEREREGERERGERCVL